jgi:PAS domain S-box-containing protein
MLGYKPEEMHGMSAYDFVFEEDRAIGNAIHESGLKGGKWHYDFKYRRRDGSPIWVMVSSSAMYDKKGDMTGYFAMLTDITERKRIEKEHMDAKSQAELYVDLMGHDINNMNQIGMGFLELALDTLNLDENGKSLLSKPMLAFESSTRLIDNVRKLQRAKSGEPLNVEMDIGQVLKDVQYHYSHLHGGNVSIDYVPVIGYVVRANELLYDVFSNLVGNSIKHSNCHPVINIKIEQVQENNHDYYKVSIEDNGPGIPDDLKPTIFTRRLSGGSKAKGSGIGLFLVKTLVDYYGGRIWVEDRVDGEMSMGSRFVVLLPAVE